MAKKYQKKIIENSRKIIGRLFTIVESKDFTDNDYGYIKNRVSDIEKSSFTKSLSNRAKKDLFDLTNKIKSRIDLIMSDGMVFRKDSGYISNRLHEIIELIC